MKAIVYSEYGPPEVLRLQELDKPVPKDNEILIRVFAAPVNFGDTTARNFKNLPADKFHMPGFLRYPALLAFGFRKPRKPVLGSELSGVVEAVGKAATKFKPGDEVFAYRGMEMGAYAEYLCMPEDKAVALRPANLSHAESAALPYGGIMALGLLKNANIQPGQKVLINGASGGIGAIALQLAKYYGAETTGVCGPSGLEYVRALGAGRVIDYTREDFTRNGERYDLIFDVLGKASFAKCKDSLTPNGRLLYVSFKMRQMVQMWWTAFAGGKKVICAMTGENAKDLELIRSLAESGKVKSIVDKTFTSSQAAEAHRYYESGKKKGSVVIVL